MNNNELDELIKEAESRGILDTETKEAIAELRRRQQAKSKQFGIATEPAELGEVTIEVDPASIGKATFNKDSQVPIVTFGREYEEPTPEDPTVDILSTAIPMLSSIVGARYGGKALGKSGAPILPSAMSILGGAAGYTIPEAGIQAIKGESVTPTGVATSLGIGALGETAGALAGKFGVPLMQNIIRPYILSPAQKQIVTLAESYGIKLTPGNITDNAFYQQMERILKWIPFTSGAMQKHDLHNMKALMQVRSNLIFSKGTSQSIEKSGELIQREVDVYLKKYEKAGDVNIDTARDNLMLEIGSKETYKSLGESAQEAIKSASKVWADEADLRYLAFTKHIPKDITLETANMSKTAISFLKQYHKKFPEFRNAKLDDILNRYSGLSTEDIVRSTAGIKSKGITKPLEMSFESYHENMKSINAMIADNDDAIKLGITGAKGYGTEMGGVLKQLKEAMTADLDVFAATKSPKEKELYKIATKFYKEGKDVYNDPTVISILSKYPEKYIDLIMSGEASGVIAYKRALGKKGTLTQRKGMLALKGGLTKKMLKGFTTGDALLKEIDAYGEALDEIYTPIELNKLKKLAYLEQGITADLADNEFFKHILSLEDTPSEVMNFIIQPGYEKHLDIVYKAVGENGIKRLAKQFLTTQLKLNMHNFLDPEVLLKTLHNYGDGVMNKLLGKDTYTALKNFATVGAAARLEPIAKSTPAGGHGFLLYTTAGLVLRSVAKGVTFAIGLTKLPELYLNPKVVKLLTEGYNLPASSPKSAHILAQLLTLIGAENYTKIKDSELPMSDTSLKARMFEMPKLQEMGISTTQLEEEESPLGNAISNTVK